MKRLLIILPSCFLLLLPNFALAAPELERLSTTPTGWNFLFAANKAEVNSLLTNQNNRLVSLDVDGEKISVATVKNSGAYGAASVWYLAKTEAQVKQILQAQKMRIVDLETYYTGGKRRLAFTAVDNTGANARISSWDSSVTAGDISKAIKNKGLRLVDLDSFVVQGQKRYSYVAVKNSGFAKKTWWWHFGLSKDGVAKKLKEHGARLVSIEPASGNKFDVIMAAKSNYYWHWGVGLTSTEVRLRVLSHGERVIDLEGYGTGVDRRYAYIAVDNSSGETARLRTLLEKAFSNSEDFGPAVYRSMYLKEIGGETIAKLGSDLRMQPASVIKLLPYVYAIDEMRKDTFNLPVFGWIEATVDNPDTTIDERVDQNCLTEGAENTRYFARNANDVLPTMMWESHNRSLDAVMDEYEIENIAARAKDPLAAGGYGMSNTDMYHSCERAGKLRWNSNRTTLEDLGKLFIGIKGGSFWNNPYWNDYFYSHMINWKGNESTSFASLTTGRDSGRPALQDVEALQAIVKQEAGAKYNTYKTQFWADTRLYQKGGGGAFGDDGSFAMMSQFDLPFYSPAGGMAVKSYLAGQIVNRVGRSQWMKDSGCTFMMETAACQNIWQPEYDDLFSTFFWEQLRIPIRRAWASYPNS